MPFAAKMDALQSEIGCHECVVCSGHAKNRAIIADAADDLGRTNSLDAFADAFDQRFFGKGHGTSLYKNDGGAAVRSIWPERHLTSNSSEKTWRSPGLGNGQKCRATLTGGNQLRYHQQAVPRHHSPTKFRIH
jgi:hypothetical protein